MALDHLHEAAPGTWLDDYLHPHGFCLANFDPALVVVSDIGGLLTASAYMLGVPFAAAIWIKRIPNHIRFELYLAVAFVYACGVSHVLDVIVTHKATYLLYLITVWEIMATGVISWAFVLAVFRAGRRAKVRVVVEPSG